MIKNKFTHLSLLFFVFAFAIGMQGQVTIGKAEKPSAGALLDLKNLDTPGADGSTANKGMMLPRVELSDVSKLYPMLPSGYDVGENAKHNGLIVFNMGTGDIDLCLGIYVWDSQKWNRIPEPCNNSLWSTTNLTFYKSALAAKSITLDLSRDNAKVTWAHDSAIPWLAGGFPQDDTRKITKTFSFRPQPNVAGADLTSNVTATVNSGGKVSTETITITQLNREMTFATPATVYSAVGAEHSLNVDSEADWTALVSSTNPGSMITAIAANSQTAGNNRTMKVTLANNDTWAERIAKLDITSTNPDFLLRTVDVKQDIATPNVVITSPAPNSSGDIEIDITNATGAAPTKVAITTNANWYYAENNAGVPSTTIWQNVIGSAIPSLMGEHVGGPGTQTTNHVINFLPTGTGNDSPAGTVHQVNMVLETRSHGTAPQSRKNILVKRTVPTVIGPISMSPASGSGIPQGGRSVQVTVNSNREVAGVAWTGSTSNTQIAGDWAPVVSGYASRTATFGIGAYNVWNATRTLYIKRQDYTGYFDVGTYTQPGWNLYHDMGGSTNLPGTAGNAATQLARTAAWYTVTMKTNSATPNFRMHSNNQTNGSGLWVDGGFTQNVGNRSVLVPANDTWAGRTVGIHHDKPGWPDVNNPEGWHQVGSYLQPGYDLSANGGNIHGATIAADGNGAWAYYVDTWTANGAPNFRVAIANGVDANGQPAAGWVWFDENAYGGVGARGFYIPANTTASPRALQFFVEQAGNKWMHVASATQAGQPWLSSGDWWVKETPMVTVGYSIEQVRTGYACAHQNGAGWVNATHSAVYTLLQNNTFTLVNIIDTDYKWNSATCAVYGLGFNNYDKNGYKGSATPWAFIGTSGCNSPRYADQNSIINLHVVSNARCVKYKY